MDDEAAILSAVAAHPGEDTPRLAYADWLDDHAAYLPDPDSARVRAEFIRVQCELKKLEDATRAEHDQYIDLYRRQDAIRTRHRRELLGPLGDDFTEVEMNHDVVFDRGFVTELKLDAGRFLKHAAEIAALKPLPEVRVEDGAAFLPELDRVPYSRTLISSLAMQSGKRTELFELGDYLTSAEIRLDTWERLGELEMWMCGLGDTGLSALVESGGFPTLTQLGLSDNEISAAGVQSLVASPLWPRLKRLVLDRNPLGDDGAFALADAPPTAIRFLNVRGCGIGQAGRQRLLRRRGWNVALF